MKKSFSLLIMFCSILAVSCFDFGNEKVDTFSKAVNEAIEQVNSATSLEEITNISNDLQIEMDKIAEDLDNDIAFSKKISSLRAKYLDAAVDKTFELRAK